MVVLVDEYDKPILDSIENTEMAIALPKGLKNFPFDILLYLKQKEFRNFWFETGAPAFLIELLRTGRYFIPEIHKLITWWLARRLWAALTWTTSRWRRCCFRPII